MINRPIIQKSGEFRSRKLLDLAHRVTICQNCTAYSADGCEPAHSNWGAHGKAKSLKADDCFHAALCHDCHAWLDQGTGFDPSRTFSGAEKLEMWQRAANRTQALYWKSGWLKVVA